MKVCELFFSIEGEGLWSGRPTSVVRLSGCNKKCPFCFGSKTEAAHPRVSLLKGAKKRLKDLIPGDVLLTYGKNFTVVETTVTEVLHREVTEWLELQLGKKIYWVTPEHPFFTTRGMVPAKDLQLGDQIYHSTFKIASPEVIANHNGIEVKSIKYIKNQGVLPVYNISCAPYNTYLLDDMWVHNCDSKFTFLGGANNFEEQNVDTLMQFLTSQPTKYVSITGGEPLYRPPGELIELEKLVERLVLKDYQVKIETNTTLIHSPLFHYPLLFSLSPKLKAMSGEEPHIDSSIIDTYIKHYLYGDCELQLKFIIGSRLKDSTMNEDLEAVKNLIREFPNITEDSIPIILQPEGLTENLQEYALRYALLCERLTFENKVDPNFWSDINYRVTPQLHKIAWMNRRQV